MSRPEKVNQIKEQIKNMKDGSIVGVTSTNSPKHERFELNVSNKKVSKFDSVYKIIYSPKGKVKVFHSVRPSLSKIKKGKSPSQTRVLFFETSFIDVTSKFVN
jgi:hypothetical protein